MLGIANCVEIHTTLGRIVSGYMTTKFSANLGFLWNELPLPDAICAAKAAGFDAVECHWPYDHPESEVRAALRQAALPMLGLNTRRGDLSKSENGLAALPGREAEAQAAIEQAIDYAASISASHVHVMAGVASGDEARKVFVENLKRAAIKAARHKLDIVIEPLNHIDAPGYFLSTTAMAERIITEVGAPNLKLMFDCYHVQIMEGNLSRRLEALRPLLGHVQIASVPDRAEPDCGEVDYRHITSLLVDLVWKKPIGAEYRPRNGVEAGLAWIERLRR